MTAPEAEPRIDWEHLDSISDAFSPDFLEIYREFLLDLPVMFENLHRAVEQQDGEMAIRVLHKIKGSAANFGFVGVSQRAADAEASAKQSVDFAALATAHAAICAVFESSRQEVGARIEG